jgi:hypothetical protein
MIKSLLGDMTMLEDSSLQQFVTQQLQSGKYRSDVVVAARTQPHPDLKTTHISDPHSVRTARKPRAQPTLAATQEIG